MSKLKKCPFCGNSGELKLERTTMASGEYEYTDSVYIVRCVICFASASRVAVETLGQFTKHTVQDFRDNPALRARVEDEYAGYLKEKRYQARENWNRRVK